MPISTIEYTDHTWNPVTGCTKVSPGCDHCYAERMSARLDAMGQTKYRGVTKNGKWTGLIRCYTALLDIPVKRKKPTVYFVNSMSDSFHPSIPLSFFRNMWNAMVLSPQHRFLLLTKRPEHIASALGPNGINFYAVEDFVPCPQANIGIGVTAENQEQWNKRVPILRKVSAAMRFVSIEPMLGSITPDTLDGIDWIIIGCESGSGRRHPTTKGLRKLVTTCMGWKPAKPIFLKQWPYGNGITKMPKWCGRVLHERPEWFFQETPNETTD